MAPTRWMRRPFPSDMADLSNGMAWFAAAASLLLLIVSAFVSGSEIAFFSL